MRLETSLLLGTVILLGVMGCTPDRSNAGRIGSGTASRDDGQVVGNGGDPIQQLFEQGRMHVVNVLRRITPEALRYSASDHLKKDEIEWLVAHRDALAEDVHTSPHRWRATLPEGMCRYDTCACTVSGKAADVIHLSSSACATAVRNKQEAGRLLAHESVHHLLGEDEGAADRIAAAVYLAWRQMGHPEGPHWVPLPEPAETGPSFLSASGSVWTGSELLVLSGDRAQFFDPRGNQWRSFRTANTLHDLKAETCSLGRLQWSAGRALIFDPSCQSPGFAGVIYDPANNRWERMPGEGSPAFRREPLLVASNDRLAVWGETVAGGTEGGIFHPSKGKWSPISFGSALGDRVGASGVWAGDKLVVWGGRAALAAESDSPYSRSGAIYDAVAETWKSMPKDDAPLGRAGHGMVWTGSSVIVHGGRWPGDSFQTGNWAPSHFGVYFLSENRWKGLSDAGLAFTGRDLPRGGDRGESFAVWIGFELVTVGSRLAAYTPSHGGRWEVSNDFLPPARTGRTSAFWTGMEILVWSDDEKRGHAIYP